MKEIERESMKSSDFKRGLAFSAVTALAVAGVPFLATSASAVPLVTQVTGVEILSPEETGPNAGPGGSDADGVSIKNDGQNNTVSLVAAAEADVNSLAFAYREVGDTDWTTIGSAVSRNADGVFQTEWAPTVTAGTEIEIRAVGNNGDQDVVGATVLGTGADVHTVELSTEGSLGIYQNPFTDSDFVAVHGTTSVPAPAGPAVAIYDQLNNVNAGAVEIDEANGAARFSGVLEYDNYPYSAGNEPNQVAISAALGYPQTTDTEASTLYIQSVATVTAEPENTNISSGTTPTTVTVVDAQGEPVAGVRVGYRSGVNDPATPADERVDHPNAGTTNADGVVVLDLGPDTYTVYADTEDQGGNNTSEFSAGDVVAAPFTIGQYTPEFETIEIVNERDRSNFDNDELSDGDDFTIVTEDQEGNPIDENLPGADVQYRFVFTPSDGSADETTQWTDAEIGANGEADVAVPDLGEGTYRLEARRPNVQGSGLTDAAPVEFAVSEAEVTFDEGADANAPIEGGYTVTGRLANDEGGLAGRVVTVNYGGTREDSRLAPQDDQPNGVTRVSDTQATVVTGADGTFSLALTDPAGPVVVEDDPEDATLTVTDVTEAENDSTSLNVGAASIDVHFRAAAEVDSIDIEATGDAAPGRPADLDITVYGPDGPDAGTDPDVVTDEPVTVTVDKGFLTDGTLAEGNDAEGDLYGFFEDQGQEQELSTGDAGDAAEILAAIERDPGFDDDGRVTVTVTVTAGDVTETQEITFDSRNYLNLDSLELVRAEGEATGDVEVGGEVAFNLFARDQFGNLVGDQPARITDDSEVADVTTDGDFGDTLTDFLPSGANIVASSDAPAVQTLLATMTGVTETLVDDNGNADAGTRTVTDASDPINWVEAPPVEEPEEINLVVTGKGGKKDRIKANADDIAAGATAVLQRNGRKIDSATLKANGNFTFKVKDRNGKKNTRYVVKVRATETTLKDKGSVRVK